MNKTVHMRVYYLLMRQKKNPFDFTPKRTANLTKETNNLNKTLFAQTNETF